MQKLLGSKLSMLLKPGLQSLLTTTSTGMRTSSAKAGRTPVPNSTLSNLQAACGAADSTAGAKHNGMLQSERKANSVYHQNHQQVKPDDLLVVMVINRVGFPFTLQHAIAFCTSSEDQCAQR